MSAELTQVVVALAGVVGLIVVLGFSAKKLRERNIGAGSDLAIVASTYLGPKERVILLKVEQRQYLVGVHPQGMTAIGELPAVEPAANFAEQLAEQQRDSQVDAPIEVPV